MRTADTRRPRRPGARLAGAAGFTLFEMTVAVALLSLVLVAFMSVTAHAARVRLDAALEQSARDEASRVVDMVSHDLRRASLASIAVTPQSPVSSRLRLTAVEGLAYDARDIPRAVLAAGPVAYDHAGGRVTRAEAGRTVLVSASAVGLVIERLGAGRVFRVRVDVEKPGVELDPVTRQARKIAVSEELLVNVAND